MKTRRSCRALVVVLLAGCLTAAACSIEDDYETLSFWFDGVPKPGEELAGGGQEVVSGPDTQEVTGARLSGGGWKPSLPEGFSRHEPYAQQDCGACHKIEARGDFFGGVPQLRAGRDKLCLQCHEPEQAAYVHGPSASGACYICHEAHQSNYPALRRMERLDTLCLDCHTDGFFQSKDRHEPWKEQACVSCHDPHASEHAWLLREPQE